MCVCVYMYVSCILSIDDVHVYLYMYINMHVCMYVCMYVCMHTYSHTPLQETGMPQPKALDLAQRSLRQHKGSKPFGAKGA